jgi:hypothetical protein
MRAGDGASLHFNQFICFRPAGFSAKSVWKLRLKPGFIIGRNLPAVAELQHTTISIPMNALNVNKFSINLLASYEH